MRTLSSRPSKLPYGPKPPYEPEFRAPNHDIIPKHNTNPDYHRNQDYHTNPHYEPDAILLTSGALLLSLEVEGRLEAAAKPLLGPPPPPRKKAGPDVREASPAPEGGRGLVDADKESGGSVERE